MARYRIDLEGGRYYVRCWRWWFPFWTYAYTSTHDVTINVVCDTKQEAIRFIKKEVGSTVWKSWDKEVE